MITICLLFLIRYDDRYYSRTMDPLYDNYYNDQRPAYNPNYNNYNYNNNYNARGNGYDNTNPALYEQMRERFNRGKIMANKKTIKLLKAQ